MLMKATPFFSKERAASEARRLLLSSFRQVTIVNFAQLRREDLFPAVQAGSAGEPKVMKATTGPALLFVGAVGAAEPDDVVEIVNVPWTSGFKHHGVLEIAPELRNRVQLETVRSDPVLFKAATYGNARELAVMHELRSASDLLPLLQWCARNGVSADQGLQIGGGGQGDARALLGLPFLDARSYHAGHIPVDLAPFALPHAHRPRDRSIYRGPLVLCPESSFSKALQKGRYSSALTMRDTVFTDSLVGLSFAQSDVRFAPVLNLVLNSKITAFQLAFGGSNIGLKQPKIEKVDLEALMIPNLIGVDDHVLKAAARLNDLLGPNVSPQTLRNMDAFVYDLYGLSSFDQHVIEDVFSRSRAFFLDTQEERRRTTERVSAPEFIEYGREVTHWLDTLVRDTGGFRTVLDRALTLGQDLVALKFELDDGPLKPLPPFSIGAPGLIEFPLLSEALAEGPGPMNETRLFMRVYASRSIYIVKPNERRYWRASDAQEDVQRILDDQRLRTGARPVTPLNALEMHSPMLRSELAH
jgi:hypothetical protein